MMKSISAKRKHTSFIIVGSICSGHIESGIMRAYGWGPALSIKMGVTNQVEVIF
jgi:hypothetical protein